MSAAPGLHKLLDDGFAPASCKVLVIGCGNILRGDDAVGPVLIRYLWDLGVPPSVRMVDGGTAGMDVAFQMRGAERVVIVDASSTGEPAGTAVGSTDGTAGGNISTSDGGRGVAPILSARPPPVRSGPESGDGNPRRAGRVAVGTEHPPQER